MIRLAIMGLCFIWYSVRVDFEKIITVSKNGHRQYICDKVYDPRLMNILSCCGSCAIESVIRTQRTVSIWNIVWLLDPLVWISGYHRPVIWISESQSSYVWAVWFCPTRSSLFCICISIIYFFHIFVYKTFIIFSVEVYGSLWILYYTAAFVPSESITKFHLTICDEWIFCIAGPAHQWYEWADPAGLRLMSERSGVIPGDVLFCHMLHPKYHINGLVQHDSNSIVLPMELLQSCAKSSACFQMIYIVYETCINHSVDAYGLPEVIPTKMALYEVAHQFLVPTMLRCEE